MVASYGYASTPECSLSADISYLVIAEMQRSVARSDVWKIAK